MKLQMSSDLMVTKTLCSENGVGVETCKATSVPRGIDMGSSSRAAYNNHTLRIPRWKTDNQQDPTTLSYLPTKSILGVCVSMLGSSNIVFRCGGRG